MRFNDRIPFSYKDAVWVESEHERDKDGKFAKTGSTGNESATIKKKKRLRLPPRNHEYKPEDEITIKRSNAVIDSAIAELSRTKDAYGVVKRAAESLKGYIKCNIPEYGNVTVHFGSDFVNESRKHVNEAQPREKVRTAREQLECFRRVPILLGSEKAHWSAWRHTPDHNEDFDFLRVSRWLDYKGEKLRFFMDLKRLRVDHSRGVWGYHVANQLMPKYRNDLGSTKKTKDELPDDVIFVAWNVGFTK